jgi:protein SCO1
VAVTRRGKAALAGLVALAFVAACGGTKTGGERRYPLRGTVSSVNRAVREVVVAHEAVPGFMPAMTMPFPIADDKALAELERGDRISATLVVGETRAYLEGVKVERKAAADLPPARPPGTSAEPDLGDAAPDATFVNQDGKKVHLADYRGRALAVTLIFTRCPLPDFCPRMISHFAEVEAELARQPALAAKAHLLAVSFDPKFDTPDVLRAYGKRALKGGGFDRFELLTGDPAEVKRLADFLSLDFEEDGPGFTHNLRTAVLDKEGKLFRLYRGNDWAPGALLADLQAAAAGP